MQRRLREAMAATIMGCAALCGAAEDDSRWVHPFCRPLLVESNGPFVELADKRLMTIDAGGMFTSMDDGKTWSKPKGAIVWPQIEAPTEEQNRSSRFNEWRAVVWPQDIPATSSRSFTLSTVQERYIVGTSQREAGIRRQVGCRETPSESKQPMMFPEENSCVRYAVAAIECFIVEDSPLC